MVVKLHIVWSSALLHCTFCGIFYDTVRSSNCIVFTGGMTRE